MDFNLVDSVLRHLQGDEAGYYFCYYPDGSWTIRDDIDHHSCLEGVNEDDLRKMLISLREIKKS